MSPEYANRPPPAVVDLIARKQLMVEKARKAAELVWNSSSNNCSKPCMHDDEQEKDERELEQYLRWKERVKRKQRRTFFEFFRRSLKLQKSVHWWRYPFASRHCAIKTTYIIHVHDKTETDQGTRGIGKNSGNNKQKKLSNNLPVIKECHRLCCSNCLTMWRPIPATTTTFCLSSTDNSRSLSSTEENILSSSSSTDDRTEQFQDQSVVMLPVLPPKRKKSVRRCGTLLLKHIQTVFLIVNGSLEMMTNPALMNPMMTNPAPMNPMMTNPALMNPY
uniref:Uncharacterized protein n=1 Tax=Globodera pallida TaxID=36090 RepID=A0A183CLE9_GLOPA